MSKVKVIFASGDIRGQLADLLGPLGCRVFAVYDSNVRDFALGILPSGTPSFELDASEGAKTMDTALSICRFLLAEGAGRDSLLFCIGGGVTSDIGGFAASIYKRGIRWAVVPTTLLSMVDAGIGGKTGVNLDALKNMLGVIRQPEFTFICQEPLATLPRRQFLSGSAELLKTFILYSEQDYASAVAVLSGGEPYKGLWPLVRKAASFKAEIVQADERETGMRRILNLGHTWGHAIEWYQQRAGCGAGSGAGSGAGVGEAGPGAGLPYTHGEAVAIGIIEAARESVRRGLCPEGVVDRLVADFTACSLPVALPCPASCLTEAIAQDKKSRGGNVDMVLLSGIGSVAHTRVTRVRATIAETDRQIAELFKQRMELCGEIAQIKKAEGLPVYDAVQEEKVLERAGRDIADPSLEGPYKELMVKMMDLSKKYQKGLIETGGNCGRFGLLGEHLGHSFSPRLHAELGCPGYELFEVRPEEMEEFLSRRDFKGLNVTIPYKKKVMPLLDSISDDAAEAGAVNTIVNDGGHLRGYNTDIDGFIALARHAGAEFSGASVLILGDGGAAAAVKVAALRMGAASAVNAVRNPREGQLKLSRRLCGHFDILVNATPVGMFPGVDECPVNLDNFGELKAVLDCIYNPLRSALVLAARRRGILAEGGIAMLVGQAVRSHELFGGSSGVQKDWLAQSLAPLVQNLAGSLENIALCGMPSCGKSTVGKLLAERLGREFVDTDTLVEKREGRSIEEIFRTDGEGYFREIESEVIAEVSKRCSLVIALGGGAVLSRENVRHLQMNSRLVLLLRDLSHLVPGGGRPLSGSPEALAALYEERMGIYRGAADLCVSNNGRPEQCVENIVSGIRSVCVGSGADIEFTKMEGLGNSYVFIDESRFHIADPEELAIRVSDFQKGIGSDGLVLIGRSAVADFSMKIYNADGSRAQMCGNAARCVARYVYDRGLTLSRDISLETDAGVKMLHILDDGMVSVEMGSFKASRLKINEFDGWVVNVGNPHFVIFRDTPWTLDEVLRHGPLLEKHPAFPERTNVEFASICDTDNGHTTKVDMKVWERGSGHTLACGTGACATAAAALVLNSAQTGNYIINMEGGALSVTISDGRISMTGPAKFVFFTSHS